jgi:hypothetical protein
MNWIDRCLERLFRAAALAPQRALGELSFAAKARVLGQWRAVPGLAWRPSLLPLFRTGLAFACALLLVTLALSLRQMNQTATEEWTLPNAVVNLALTR